MPVRGYPDLYQPGPAFLQECHFLRSTQILIVDMIYMGLISSDYEHYVNQLNKCENVVRRKAYENN